MAYPFNGELYPAPKKRFTEIILFVHFFGGKRQLMRRHVDFVNGLGFDAFAFDLATEFGFAGLPFAKELRFGLRHVYCDQIEELLDLLPGRKIVFAFSNPSGGAIEALARRNCRDVAALVCDSGPSARLVRSVLNLHKAEKRIRFWPLRLIAVPLLCLRWSLRMHRDLGALLGKMPKGFPVLSIRGALDELISPEDIEAVFTSQKHLELRTLLFEKAGHLNGLRDCRAEYAPAVEKFLKDVSSPV